MPAGVGRFYIKITEGKGSPYYALRSNSWYLQSALFRIHSFRFLIEHEWWILMQLTQHNVPNFKYCVLIQPF